MAAAAASAWGVGSLGDGMVLLLLLLMMMTTLLLLPASSCARSDAAGVGEGAIDRPGGHVHV